MLKGGSIAMLLSLDAVVKLSEVYIFSMRLVSIWI